MPFRRATVLPFLLALACGALATAQRRGGLVEPGPWTRQKVPPGWVMHETRNYQIQSQAGLDKAKRLGEHMEQMNRVYRDLFRPDKDGQKRQVIKLLKDRENYLGYGAPPSSAAYYSRTEREMVCYDTGKWSDEAPTAAATTGGAEAPGAQASRRLRRLEEMMTMDILGCAAHEGWHQYFDWLVVSMITLPSWINEGMGDYFYTAAPKVEPGRKRQVELGRLNEGRLLVLKAAMARGRFVPLERLLSMSKHDFYADASVCYAEGWAFCQFLLHSGNPKYAKIISSFVRLVKDDTNMATVTEKAFQGFDLAAMEAEFKAWIAALQVPGGEAEDDDADAAAGDGDGAKGEGAPAKPAGGEPGAGGGG